MARGGPPFRLNPCLTISPLCLPICIYVDVRSYFGSSRAMASWPAIIRETMWPAIIREAWLNGPEQIGKKHRTNKRRWSFHHGIAMFTLRSVVNKVLLELEEAGVFARTLLAMKIATRSPVKCFIPVKTFLLECITSIIHSDRPLHL